MNESEIKGRKKEREREREREREQRKVREVCKHEDEYCR